MGRSTKSVKQMVSEIMQEPRNQIVERLMHGFGQVLTTDQYRKIEQFFLNMPDVAFEQMVEESIRRVQQETPTAAQHFNLGMKLQERFNVNPTNSALNIMPPEFLPATENAELWDAINRSQPSDYISLKKAEDIAICEHWRKDRSLPEGAIPSDLFFTGNIRFMDCYISVDETEDNGVEVEYRVVVFPDYQDRIRSADGKPVYVGAIVLEPLDSAIFFPLKVCEGFEFMMTGGVGYHNIPDKLLKYYKENWTKMTALEMGSELLSTWYGIHKIPRALHKV